MSPCRAAAECCCRWPPAEPNLIPYDRQHAITFARLLDAAAEGADWRELSRIVLKIDPDRNAEQARRAFDHLARARWLSREGYRHLLREGSASRHAFMFT
jgi:hypothetical protein